MEREIHNSPEETIQNLVGSLEIIEGIYSESIPRGKWFKQYGNTSDPDEEYEIRLNSESVNRANEAKHSLWELGNKQPEVLGTLLKSLLSKQLPADETHYVISKTETGFQMVTPEPGDEPGWTWISGSETKRMINETVLGFGLKAVPHLKAMETKRSRRLVTKIKRRELGKKIKRECFLGSRPKHPAYIARCVASFRSASYGISFFAHESHPA